MTRYDPRKISLHKSYTIPEFSVLLGMSEKNCRRWVKQGLPTVPGSHKPILILGFEAKNFIRQKNNKPKVELKRHEFYCFTCKHARRAKKGSICVSENIKTGICHVCNSKMSRTIHPIKKDYKILSPPIQMSMFNNI